MNKPHRSIIIMIKKNYIYITYKYLTIAILTGIVELSKSVEYFLISMIHSQIRKID